MQSGSRSATILSETEARHNVRGYPAATSWPIRGRPVATPRLPRGYPVATPFTHQPLAIHWNHT